MKKPTDDLETRTEYQSVVLEAHPDIMIVRDSKYRIKWANKAACSAFNLDLKKIIDRYCWQLLFDSNCSCPDCPMIQPLRPGIIYTDYKMSPRGKTWRIRYGCLSTGHDDMDLFLIIAEENLEAASDVSGSDAHQRLILDTMQEMLAYYGTDLCVKWANKAAAASVGLNVDDLVGRHCYEIWQQRKTPCENCPVMETIETGSPREGEATTPDGRIYHLRGYPVFSETGTIIGAVEYGRDITAHKQIEKSLKKNEDRLKYLVSESPTVIYTCDVAENYGATFVSENVISQLGYPPEAYTSDSEFWIQHIHPGDRERILDNLSSLFKTGHHTHEYRFLHMDGTYRWMRDELKLIRDSHGKPLEIIGSWIDITHIKKAEQALQRAYRESALREQISKLFLTSPKNRIFHDMIVLLLKEFESRFGYIGYIDTDGDLVCPSMTFNVWDKCRVAGKSIVFERKNWNGLWGLSLKDKRPLYRNGNLNLPQGHIKLDNAMVSPMIVNQDLVGQIALANHPSGYDENDLKRLLSFSEFIAPILQIFLEKENAETGLQTYASELEKKNIALNVLLDNRNEEKAKLADRIFENFEKQVFPYYDRLKKRLRHKDLKALMDIIENNTHTSLSMAEKPEQMIYRRLTPTETQVADLIKQGKTSKEIATLLNLSTRSVFFHRNNIRKKMNIQHTGTNLRSFLTGDK